MKLRCETTINADRSRVWELFDDPQLRPRWQPTLASYRQQSGEPGRPGAVAELVYDDDGRRVVVTETIAERRRPHFLAALYRSRHTTTLIVNQFETLDEGRSRWISWCNVRFHGVRRLISPFIAASVRRGRESDMDRFRRLLENGGVPS